MKKLSGIFLVVLAFAACKNEPSSQNDDPATTATIPNLTYNIVGTHPHDTSYFTEGLQWYKGALYESTGNKGFSKLLKVNLKSGAPEKELKLKDEFFGEGLTVLRDTVYQMTWQEQTVFVYDANTFKQIKTFTNDRDGWGMTTDSTNLIVSDGTNNIYYRDPATFKLLKIVSVSDNNGPLGNLNELEYVNGFIYANIWNTDIIVKIDPTSGNLVGRLDLAGLLERSGKEGPDPSKGNVLNGIAYNPETATFYITGKNWPMIFEMKF